jgi:SAM-dependent methyltransferase
MNDVPRIFDTRLRRLRRARAARSFQDFAFLGEAVAGEIGERLAATPRPFARAVWCGAVEPPPVADVTWLRGDAVAAFALRGVVFDEEFLPFGAGTLDLYASALTLHAANDLPGALTQIRRALKADGLFMAALFGGQTLHELRVCLAEAEIEIDGGLSPRVAPFVDIRDAGALLQRAGFVQPVADVDVVHARYEHPLKLLADLRGMGETNVLGQRRRSFLKRRVLARACELYVEKFRDADGRVAATFEILYLTGWARA